MKVSDEKLGCMKPGYVASARRARRVLRQASQRRVVRSVKPLIVAQKPRIATSALKAQLARLNAPMVSAIAARPPSFRIARVLLPFDSRHVLRGFSDLEPVHGGPRSRFRLHAAGILHQTDEAARPVELDRLARRAHRRRRLRQGDRRNRPPQRRQVHRVPQRPAHPDGERPPIFPALRAPLSADTPRRAGPPAPSEA